MALRLALLLCHLWMAWARHRGHGGHSQGTSFFGFKFPSFKFPTLPGFSTSKRHSMMTPFDMFNQAFSPHKSSKKSSFGLPGLPGFTGNGKTEQGSGDMMGMMCGMMRMPLVCDSKSQGINTAECRKNPTACCGKSVKRCSTTDPFTFASPCGAVGEDAKCVGSVMTSFQKVGVCMCQGGTTCNGFGSQAKCSSGNLNAKTFSILYEEDEIEAEPELNPSGVLACATFLISMALLISLVVRGWRARGQQPQLLSQDVEAEGLD